MAKTHLIFSTSRIAIGRHSSANRVDDLQITREMNEFI